MKKLIQLGAFALVAFSCSTVLKKSYGIKDPELETIQTINLYLSKKGIDTSKTYVFKDLVSFAQASENKFLRFPDAYFFNEKGQAVNYPKTSENCNAQVGSFIADMKSFSEWPADSTRNVHEFISLLSPAITYKTAEVNVLLTFTTYSGRLNDEKAFEWIRLLEKLKKEGIDVKYYLVSCDYQKSWNIPPALQKKLGIKQK